MKGSDVVSTLNGLIEMCKDVEDGFKSRAEDAGESHPEN